MDQPTNSSAVRRRESAQSGHRIIMDAILDLLTENPQGLGNSEIAEMLGLHSGLDGRQKDYLTWAILQDLVYQKKLKRIPRPNSSRKHLYQIRN